MTAIGYGPSLACPNDIVARYTALAYSIAREFFAPGLDADDLNQEALVGLCKAHRDYRPDSHVPFASFAYGCIKRQVMTAVVTANRRKHTTLSKATSLDKPLSDAPDAPTLSEVLPGGRDPADIAVEREGLAEVIDLIVHRSSKLEQEAIAIILNADDYSGGYSADKRYDNAIQRVRRRRREDLAA